MQHIDKRLFEPDRKKSKPLTEKETWDKFGCANRDEWRELLNRELWGEYTPDLKNDCYIGTHESNLSFYRRTHDKRADID